MRTRQAFKLSEKREASRNAVENITVILDPNEYFIIK